TPILGGVPRACRRLRPAPRSAAVNERPGRDLRARLARDFDEGGSIVRKSTLERAAQLPRSRGTVACRTEGLGELHEVGIAQRFAEKPSAEGGLLVAQHIAEAVVVEHDRHGADAMLHGGGQLLHSEHEAAVAVDRYHRPGRIRDLDAERGHIAEAEVVLIAARDIGARLVHREAEAGGESDLADLFDEEAVARQYRADRVQEGELRLHHLELAPGTRLEI